jgi:hypothetical protein
VFPLGARLRRGIASQAFRATLAARAATQEGGVTLVVTILGALGGAGTATI